HAPAPPIPRRSRDISSPAGRARDRGVMMHTHVGEGERPVIQARHGMRKVDYLEELGFAGTDAFYAHCWELTHDELRKMAASG
ncbi:amidohydrolase, partial [Rhizobium ruizarguesonis]